MRDALPLLARRQIVAVAPLAVQPSARIGVIPAARAREDRHEAQVAAQVQTVDEHLGRGLAWGGRKSGVSVGGSAH